MIAVKYQCPLCDSVYDSRDEATACMIYCSFNDDKDDYEIIEIDIIDIIENIKANMEEFVGKCETCCHCDINANTFASCPHHGSDKHPDGCECYSPDTQAFGTLVETLWKELKWNI